MKTCVDAWKRGCEHGPRGENLACGGAIARVSAPGECRWPGVRARHATGCRMRTFNAGVSTTCRLPRASTAQPNGLRHEVSSSTCRSSPAGVKQSSRLLARTCDKEGRRGCRTYSATTRWSRTKARPLASHSSVCRMVRRSAPSRSNTLTASLRPCTGRPTTPRRRTARRRAPRRRRLQQRALSKAEELRKAGAVEGNHAVVLTITDVEPRADAAEALGRSERVARCLREMLARCFSNVFQRFSQMAGRSIRHEVHAPTRRALSVLVRVRRAVS